MTRRAFTLVELLVVIAIIGLMSSIAVVSLGSSRMNSRDTKRIADLRQIQLALSLYYDTNGYYPPSACGYDCNGYYFSNGANWSTLATALAPYITPLPKDPINSTSGVPWDTATASYMYAYGNVGRYTYPNTYDLFTRLESPTNPQRCGVQGWRFAKGIGSYMYWCTAFGGGYSNQIYEIEPAD